MRAGPGILRVSEMGHQEESVGRLGVRHTHFTRCMVVLVYMIWQITLINIQ